MLNILVIEDEKVTNDLITFKLKAEGYDVIQAFDGETAVEVLRRMNFHLVITDIVMPGKDGFEVLEFIKSENIQTTSVILSSLSGDMDQLKGFNYQIDDYLTKPFNVDVLVHKINLLIKRVYNYYKETELRYDENALLIDNEKIMFSTKEFDVLEYLYTNKLKYCSKEDIFDYVWEGAEDTSIRVVDYTIKRIRKKLDNHSDFIQTKIGVGYKYAEDIE